MKPGQFEADEFCRRATAPEFRRTRTRASMRIRHSMSMPLLLIALAMTACGGGSDSGAGTDSDNATSNPDGRTPANGGTDSLNNAASGIYESSMQVMVTGAGSDYTARIRIVIDQGGGASIWENGQLHGQARLTANRLSSTRSGVVETLFGRSCRGDRSYVATVAGGNQSVEGNLAAEYICDGTASLKLSGPFSLPRVGDHQ